MRAHLRERELLEPADVGLNTVRLVFQMPQPPKVVAVRGAVWSSALPVEVIGPPLLRRAQRLTARTFPAAVAVLADANVRSGRRVPLAIVSEPLDGLRRNMEGLPLPLGLRVELVPRDKHLAVVVQPSSGPFVEGAVAASLEPRNGRFGEQACIRLGCDARPVLRREVGQLDRVRVPHRRVAHACERTAGSMREPTANREGSGHALMRGAHRRFRTRGASPPPPCA